MPALELLPSSSLRRELEFAEFHCILHDQERRCFPGDECGFGVSSGMTTVKMSLVLVAAATSTRLLPRVFGNMSSTPSGPSLPQREFDFKFEFEFEFEFEFDLGLGFERTTAPILAASSSGMSIS